MSDAGTQLFGGRPLVGRAADASGMRLVSDHPARTALDADVCALALARVLRGHGLGGGRRVLLKAGNSPVYVVALLALMRLDSSIVLIDGQQTTQETHRLAAAAGVDFALVEQFGDAPSGLPFLTMAELDEVLPHHDAGRAAGSAAESTAHAEPLRAVSAAHTDPFRAVARWLDRDDALVLWSSGTTGEPKAVVKSGRAFLRNLDRTRQALGYRPDDVLLPVLPYSHQYGLSLVLLAWLSRGTLAVTPNSRLDRALSLGAAVGATVVDATPVTYRSLLNLAGRHPGLLAGLTKVRLWCTGGAPSDQDLVRRFPEVTGAPLLDGYGSTEIGNVSFATPDNPTGCGRVLDGLDVFVTDEAGRPLPPGEIGEIHVRTPDLMTGYLSVADGLTPAPSGPYRTGDLGHLDAAGNLFVLGRRFAVHRLGFTLYPEVLERKAEACGRPVKIVTRDDARRGQELIFVVEDPDVREASYWRRRICAALPPFEHPNRVVVVSRFPVSANGKPDGRLLARQLALSDGLAADPADRADPVGPADRAGAPEPSLAVNSPEKAEGTHP
ncbi:class I adenylate-forming enzyme family protein [Streptomyces sp. NPDC059063]|uniref:class I adenylate-forming enzyme family protein n=1 Tax=unclassified Streptomyces TaxID=2593676 RepID=UPI0036907B41